MLFATAPLLMIWFALLIAVSTIPSIFSVVGTSYVHRSSFMYPLMTILVSYGIVETVKRFIPSIQKIMAICFVLLYVGLTANFVYLYFFRFPYYNSESFGLSQRLYSYYAILAEQSRTPVINLTESPELYFRNYVFYRNAIQHNTVSTIRARFLSGNYSWKNAEFRKQCPTKKEVDNGTTAYILSNTSPCKELFIDRPMTVIPSLSNGGTLYMIFNDVVCQNYALSAYPTGFTTNDFLVEHLSREQFCTKFVIRYTNPLYQPQTREGNWISAEEK
jgi:hypothetical protein